MYAHWTRIVLLEGYCGDNLYFILYADGGLEFSGYGDMTSHPWTKNYSKRVYEVSMPQEVTSLCTGAFEGCQYMMPFELPEIEVIPNSCFNMCETFESFSIPNSITKIGESAFRYCSSLSDIELSSNLEDLGALAFANTPVTTIRISKVTAQLPHPTQRKPSAEKPRACVLYVILILLLTVPVLFCLRWNLSVPRSTA